ncbi:MAG: DUF3253 domain-containing protein [Hyphomicrobiales bacterium]
MTDINTTASVHAASSVAQAILSLVRERGPDKTICPSEAARILGRSPQPESWSGFMDPVRRAAIMLAEQGFVVIYRKGKPVDPRNFKGVYRIGLPRND